jgi:rubrerythrin
MEGTIMVRKTPEDEQLEQEIRKLLAETPLYEEKIKIKNQEIKKEMKKQALKPVSKEIREKIRKRNLKLLLLAEEAKARKRAGEQLRRAEEAKREAQQRAEEQLRRAEEAKREAQQRAEEQLRRAEEDIRTRFGRLSDIILYYTTWENDKPKPNFRRIAVTASLLSAIAGGTYIIYRHQKYGYIIKKKKKKRGKC